MANGDPAWWQVIGGGGVLVGIFVAMQRLFSGAKRPGYDAQAQLAAFKTEVETEVAALKTEVAERYVKKRDLESLRASLHGDMNKIREDMEAGRREVREDIKEAEARLTALIRNGYRLCAPARPPRQGG